MGSDLWRKYGQISLSVILFGCRNKRFLKKAATSWQKTIEATVRRLNGWMEAFYFSFGETDIFVIAELPDNVSAATFSLVVSSAGAGRVRPRF